MEVVRWTTSCTAKARVYQVSSIVIDVNSCLEGLIWADEDIARCDAVFVMDGDAHGGGIDVRTLPTISCVIEVCAAILTDLYWDRGPVLLVPVGAAPWAIVSGSCTRAAPAASHGVIFISVDVGESRKVWYQRSEFHA